VTAAESAESPDVAPDATIEGGTTPSPVSSGSENGPEADPGE
jgi:hypothetical protein